MSLRRAVVTSLVVLSLLPSLAWCLPPANRLVARTDFDVSPSLQPPPILQRRFWNLLPHTAADSRLGQLMAARVLPEPMVRDAARCYYVGDLRAPGDEPLAINGAELLKLAPDPRLPFLLLGSAGRPPFRCLDDFRVDRSVYSTWRQAHPNFLGFWTGVEWDNEFITPLSDPKRGVEWLRAHKCSETAITRATPLLERATASRAGAVAGLQQCHQALRRYFFDDPEKMVFLRGGWCFDHYAAEFGCRTLVSETTNTGAYRHQVSLSSVRGAARQYGRPWGWYIATYYNGHDKAGNLTVNNEPNYTSPVRLMSAGAGENAGPGFGMSVSLSRRDKYLAYLSGASFVQHEDWPRAYCQPVEGSPNEWGLSPHGEAMKEWYDFTQRCPDRGVSYAPVALMIPFDQGMPQWGGAAWSHFAPQRADQMIDAFLYTLVPFTQDTLRGQEGALANSEFGDLYDLVAADPPSGPVPLERLRGYKVAVALGGLKLEAPLAARLTDYVRQGGTLVVNSRQVGGRLPASLLGVTLSGKTAAVAGPVVALPGGARTQLGAEYEYEPAALAGAEPLWKDSQGGLLASVNRVGRGRLVLTTVDYLLPREKVRATGREVSMPLVALLMRQLVREVLPVGVQGDIEYGLTRTPDGWWVYLINNKGVTKYATTPEELDAAATAAVTVSLRQLQARSARELRAGKLLTIDRRRNAVSLEVGPGDIRIVHLVTAARP